jgi:hypothetical protein
MNVFFVIIKNEVVKNLIKMNTNHEAQTTI